MAPRSQVSPSAAVACQARAVPTSTVLRPARPEEAGLLSDLALRSKAHWGYPPDFLAAAAPT